MLGDKKSSGRADKTREVGIADLQFQIMAGSIGAREATVESPHQVESLAHLEEFFVKIGKIDAHAKWGKEMEPCRVGHQPVADLSHCGVALFCRLRQGYRI